MHRTTYALAAVYVIMFIAGARAQVSPHKATVEQVATGFVFVEGPALGPDGAIYFSDVPRRKVHRYDPASGETSVFLQDSGGSNGLAFDAQGDLVLCEDRDRRVSRHSGGADQPRHSLAATFDGKHFNGPNDLVIDDVGNIYFTDPQYGASLQRELKFEAVYFLTPAGEITQIITDLKRPNGIALSPNGKTLYVADNAAATIFAYDIDRPGVIGNRRVFAQVEGKGGPDGMTVDRDGNLYAAWHGGGGVHVWSAAGDEIGFIAVPEQPSNVEFGPAGHTLYITAGHSLYRAR